MKRSEIRTIVATYCDYCGAELTHFSHASIEEKDGRKLDFCNTYTNDISETCLDKYKKDGNLLKSQPEMSEVINNKNTH
jgi:hypothetical protein